MGSSPSAKAINPGDAGAESLDAQVRLAGPQYEAEKKYRPLYQELDNATLRDSLYGTTDMGAFRAANPQLAAQIDAERAAGGLGGWSDAEIIKAYAPDGNVDAYRRGGMIQTVGDATADYGDIQSAANTQQRTADIADVEALGGRSNDAFRAANPQLTGLLDLQRDWAGQSGVPSAIETELTKQAEGDLALGGNLNPAQRAMIEQQSRAAFGSRGLGRSQSAAVGEAFNAFDYSRQLQNERRQFAGTVETANQQRRAVSNNILGNAVASHSANSVDPFMSILGRSSGAMGQAQGAIGQSGALQGGPTMFNPFSSDIMGIYSGNAQNQAAAAGAKSAQQGSMMQGGAAVAAAAIVAL